MKEREGRKYNKSSREKSCMYDDYTIEKWLKHETWLLVFTSVDTQHP